MPMNVMVPRDDDHSGSIRIEKFLTKLLQEIADFAILRVDLAVGIRGAHRRTLDQITAYRDQVRPRDSLRLPSRGIADERREQLIVAQVGC